MSKIALINSGVRHELDAIGEGAELTESLDGEQTLRLTVLPEDLPYLGANTLIEFEGQYYDPAAVRRSGNALAAFAEVSAEHVTYRLNRAQYDVGTLNLGGTCAQVLAQVLNGTDFTPGTTPAGTVPVTVIEGGTRREALNTAAELMHGELSFSGWTVNVVPHRGSTTRVDLMATGNVSGVEVEENLVTGETAYRVGLIRRGGLGCGDDIRLRFAPFSLDADTRVTAITRNPYREDECAVTVGAKIPEVTDANADAAARAVYKDDADIVIRQYLNTAEGKAELESVLTGTFVTQSDLDDYPTYSELDTAFGQYIDGQAGTAKIISAASGTYQTISGMSDYATTTALASVSQSVSDMGAEIDLTASLGSGTIGSNVRALLQLVANPDSSSIMLKASKIVMDGDMYIQDVYYYAGDRYYKILSAQIGTGWTRTYIGPKEIDDDGREQATEIYGTDIYFIKNGERTTNGALIVDTGYGIVYPQTDANWDLGKAGGAFNRVYAKYAYYLWDEGFSDWGMLYTNARGDLVWKDGGGGTHTIGMT